MFYFTQPRIYTKEAKYISLPELTDPKLVNNEVFQLIVTAFLIRRYGAEVFWQKGRKSEQSQRKHVPYMKAQVFPPAVHLQHHFTFQVLKYEQIILEKHEL